MPGTPEPYGQMDDEEWEPDDLCCPISMTLMDKPVICSDGFNYDEPEIRAWLNAGNRTSPMTGEPLTSMFLKPNMKLRDRARGWLAKRDAKRAERERRGL